mgnify:CR=1 FL=1
MNTYKYQALSRGGQKVNGLIEAFNEMDAAVRIKETCDVVLKITEVKEQKDGIMSLEIGKKFDPKAFTVMCSQFGIIMKAGLPVARTVQLIAQKTTDKKLKKLLQKVAEDVESGRGLAASFDEHGGDFLPVTFIETVRAGEESGNVAESFESMAEHYDKQTKLKGKIKSALAYPIFILIVAVIVVIVLMVAVVPTFTSIFDSYGAELPGITQALISISDFFSNNIIIIVIVVAVIIIGYKLYGKTENGKLNIAKMKLKLPIIGNIQSLTGASEFANTMTTMMAAGLPMVRAINITTKVLSNYFIQSQVGKVSEKLEQGRGLADSLRETGVMPDILVDMTAVGEETGELEKTLGTIAGYYDAELEMAIDGAVSKLSPAILVVTAGIAGFIVIAMYVAMFEMYNVM